LQRTLSIREDFDAGSLGYFRGILDGIYARYISEENNTNPWWLQFLISAYRRGNKTATTEMARIRGELSDLGQSAFIMPFSTGPKDVAWITENSKNELNSIKEQFIAQSMRFLYSPTLSNKEKIISIVENAKKIVGNKARAFAQTETTRAHLMGKIDVYKNNGVRNVVVLGEWTLGYSKSGPCPYCRAHAGGVYPLDELLSLIPAHPHCRCSVIPIPVRSRRR